MDPRSQPTELEEAIMRDFLNKLNELYQKHPISPHLYMNVLMNQVLIGILQHKPEITTEEICAMFSEGVASFMHNVKVAQEAETLL